MPRTVAPLAPALLLLAALAAGCAEFPDLDAAITPQARAAPYPRIAPLSEVLAGLPEGGPADPGAEALAARAAALKARAARLARIDVVDTPTERRFDATLSRRP